MTPAVLRLARDMLGRQYQWQLQLTIVLAAIPWWLAGAGGTNARFAFAISLGMTLVIGPVVTVTGLPRAYAYLPLSRRDIWRATWLVGAVAAPAVLAALKLPALFFSLGARDGGLAIIALSTAYDFGAASMGCILLTASQRSKRIAPARALRMLEAAAMLALISTPFWVRAELTGASAVVLGLMLASIAAAFVYVPPRAAGVRRPTSAARPPLAPPPRGRLAGIPALMLREVRWAAGIGLTLAIAFAAIAYLVDGFYGELRTPMAFLRSQKLLIFDDVSIQMDTVEQRPFNLMVWFAFFAASVSGRFPELIRHLRALPISGAKMTALIVGWPAAVWVMIWAVLLLLSATIGEGVRALHPALWIQVVGLSSLSQALTLWWGDRFKWLFYSSPLWLMPLFQAMSRTHPVIGTTLAAAGLVLAAALTRRALSHSATYTNRPLPYAAPQVT